MKTVDKNVLRVVVLRRLRSVYGIHVKKKRLSERFESRKTWETSASPRVKVFGVPLHHLRMRNIPGYGLVPCFLVDSCKHLLNHAGSEGLFRKSGSVVRLKALRARLDKGEDCLSTALPCDLASLVKQFFYELPCPALPAALLQAFTSAQRLPTEEERSSATQLVSCLLPEINSSTLRFFFIFLKNVSLRASVNKMDSYNLSVVLAPNLFRLHSTPEWNDACHRLYIAVICTLIENAHTFGVVPDTIARNELALVDFHPPYDTDPHFGWKSKGRRPSEVLSLSAAGTPNPKGRILSDGAGDEFSCRKQKFFRRNLGIVPSVLFGCCYNSSSKEQDSSPPAALNRQFNKSAQRGTCRRVCKNMKRDISNTFGCVASSPREKTLPESPVASCWLQPYQDTPVGLCLKKQYSQLESVSNKPRAIRSVFKTLFCTPATDSPENQQFLTQDELSLPLCNSISTSTCLESNVIKNTSTTINLEEQSTPVVAAEQRRANGEKESILHVKCSDSKRLRKLTSKLNLLSSSSSRLVALEGDAGSLQDTFGVRLMELSSFKPLNKATPRNSKVRVVDHVEKFDKLQVKPLVPKVIRPPLKFQRTPVYQYVKRINSRMREAK
ncbi:rho GTPase-activating protein 11A [Pygocentrus nattereri]|uniref:rho GTPase-activating protein 11A n=1 Tax=Pygocentrus nattereri TaxID=42514 RepID=UPI000814405E|nr:rho GTPase-activating protein 11A [Pygocentrus nattereri]